MSQNNKNDFEPTAGKSRLIRSAHELPDWYKLENYDACKSLDEIKWCKQLEVRQAFYLFFGGLQKRKQDEFYEKIIIKNLNLIRLSPLKEIYGYEALFIGGGPFSQTKYNKGFFEKINGISRVTVLDILMVGHDFPTIFSERAPELYALLSDANYPENDRLDLSDDEELQSLQEYLEDASWMSKGHIRVNLNLPDKVLMKQFAAYLKSVRKKEKGNDKDKNLYRHYDHKKWVEYAVLPYLDLLIWSMEEGVEIPRRVMADAIYPSGTKGEEAVRKTTEKLAMNVISHEIIRLLVAKASEKFLERNA